MRDHDPGPPTEVEPSEHIPAGSSPSLGALGDAGKRPIAPAVSPFGRLARVVGWAICLGLVLELLLLAARLTAGVRPGAIAIVAETVQKTSWSMLVCAALAAAQTIRRALPATVALVGFVFAPLGLLLARALHKSTLQALGGAAAAAPAREILVLASVKALEYAVFGLVVGRLAARGESRLTRYLLPAALIGAATVTVLAVRKGTRGMDLALLTINELFFPMGCAFVLFIVGRAAALSRKG